MFLINHDGMNKLLDPMASQRTYQSWSSVSSDSFGEKATPSSAMIHALIRDLSFWDATPPVTSAGGTFLPSLLPQKPQSQRSGQYQEQLQCLLQREKSLSTRDSNRSEYNRQRNSERPSNSNKGTIDGQGNAYWLPQPIWKAATDPVTGRTYYYDTVTRRTQWEKPAELRQLDKQKKSQRRKRDRHFFQEMERNILNSLGRGEVVPGIPKAKLEPTGPPLEPRNCTLPRNFRTLSSMNETILMELRDDVIPPEEFHRGMPAQSSIRTRPRSASRGRPPLPGPSRSSHSTERSQSRSRSQQQPVDASSDQHGYVNRNYATGPQLPKSCSTSVSTNTSNAKGSTLSWRSEPPLPTVTSSGNELAAPSSLGALNLSVKGPMQAEIPDLSEKPDCHKNHQRRNTGGTIYVNGTMSNPDVEATIKCVCGVYRAHLVQASEERSKRSPVSVVNKPLDLDIFLDRYHLPAPWKYNMQQDSLPSLADIVEFYQEFYRRSQMEFDTIIMSLIYVERLIKTTNLTPGPENWKSVLFSCMVLASKVWDDLSMWNIDFSNVASAQTSNQSQGLSLFTLQRVNQLELILLKSLNFDVRVPASEYAKYYFLIRTMLMRSGLLEDAAKPLSKDEAKNLENRTSQYQESKLNNERDRRTKSMYDYSWLEKSSQQSHGEAAGSDPVPKDKACLEEILTMSERG